MGRILRFTGAVKRAGDIDVWLAARDPALGALAGEWFGVMRGCGDDVRELMHDGFATVCVADAPFAYVGVFSAHVNVGFFHGAELDDPGGLLEGTGKRMRHVKLKPGVDARGKAMRALIEAAYADIKVRLSCGDEE